MTRKDMNAYELSATLYLGSLDGLLSVEEKTLEKRLKAIGGWRYYRIARAFVKKSLGMLYDSMPEKNLRHLDRMLANSSMHIKPKSMTPPKNSILIDEDIFALLINETMMARCAICMAEPAEAKACKLRKALMIVAPPNDISETGWCPYHEVTIQSELGDYLI